MTKTVLRLNACATRAMLLAALIFAFVVAASAQQKQEVKPRAESETTSPAARAPVKESRADGGSRDLLAEDVSKKREELSESEKLLLAPSPEDAETYAEFLKQPHTGLIRLLPRETFDGKLALPGGGAYYSFTRLTHEYGYGSDIGLEQNYFSTGFGGANFGFLVDLGDVPLENVNAETWAVRYLADYKPPAAEPKAREEQRRTGEGFQIEGWTYKERLPVKLDNTYAVRSIDYDTSDVLVAFRVVRKDSDGSVVLLWKLLKKYSKPKLERGSGVPAGS